MSNWRRWLGGAKTARIYASCGRCTSSNLITAKRWATLWYWIGNGEIDYWICSSKNHGCCWCWAWQVLSCCFMCNCWRAKACVKMYTICGHQFIRSNMLNGVVIVFLFCAGSCLLGETMKWVKWGCSILRIHPYVAKLVGFSILTVCLATLFCYEDNHAAKLALQWSLFVKNLKDLSI